jgi:hypothetical protein
MFLTVILHLSTFFKGCVMSYEQMSSNELAVRLRECEAALVNMNGFFNTPVARLKYPGGPMEEEARNSASDYIRKYDIVPAIADIF